MVRGRIAIQSVSASSQTAGSRSERQPPPRRLLPVPLPPQHHRLHPCQAIRKSQSRIHQAPSLIQRRTVGGVIRHSLLPHSDEFMSCCLESYRDEMIFLEISLLPPRWINQLLPHKAHSSYYSLLITTTHFALLPAMKLSFVAFLIGFSCLAASTEARDSCDSKYSECKTKAVLCQTSGQTCTVTGASCRAEWRKCKGDRRYSLKGTNDKAVCDLACSIVSKPVCGSDGVTYTNKCWFDTQALCEDPSLTIAYEGECASDN